MLHEFHVTTNDSEINIYIEDANYYATIEYITVSGFNNIKREHKSGYMNEEIIDEIVALLKEDLDEYIKFKKLVKKMTQEFTYKSKVERKGYI